MDPEPLPSSIPPGAPATDFTPAVKPPWYHWRRLGFNALTLSLVVHVLLAVLAAYLVVATYQPKKKSFAGAPPSGSHQAAEHKVSMAKAQQRATTPTALKRVTTAGLSPVSLPVMPTMPVESVVTPVGLRGMSGSGAGLGGLGSGGTGTGTGEGRAPTFFGFHDTHSGGLEGTFYDYKMDQGYQPLKKFDNKTFGTMVSTMLPVDGPWHPETPFPHFLSPAKLRARYFIFPAIEDTGAGGAFQSPRSGPGQWLAVYRGAFSSPTSGSFRFVGFGDNVMIVQLGNHMVLDASDNGYTKQKREGVGSIAFPKKGSTPLFAGEWFSLSEGEAKDISIAVGDEGGIFCSGLFIQPRSMTYAQGARGIPKLPVFMLGAATPADKALLGKELPEECLQGPFFMAAAPRASEKSIFSH